MISKRSKLKERKKETAVKVREGGKEIKNWSLREMRERLVEGEATTVSFAGEIAVKNGTEGSFGVRLSRGKIRSEGERTL